MINVCSHLFSVEEPPFRLETVPCNMFAVNNGRLHHRGTELGRM